jgi:pilus assembly protein CpaB
MRTEEATSRANPAKRTRKRLASAVALLVLAGLAALMAAFLLTRYMDARTAGSRVATTKVVVAAVDIPVASAMKVDWLTTLDWPVASRPEGVESDPAKLADRVPLVAISKGELVLASKLAQPGARGGLATLLPDGMRAVAVRVDDVVGVAGFIHPGDRVDVLVTMQARQDQPFTSKVILQHVRVLAVGKDVQHKAREAEKSVVATVATLMVTPEESEVLALAATKGKLLLTLRPIGDEELAETPGSTPPLLLAGVKREPAAAPAAVRPVATRARKAAAPPKVAAASPAPLRQKVVEILRGDLFERRDFGKEEGR